MSQQGSDCSCQDDCTPWIVATSIVSFLLAATIFGMIAWYYFRFRKILKSSRSENAVDIVPDDPPEYDTYGDAFHRTVEQNNPFPRLPERQRDDEPRKLAFESLKEEKVEGTNTQLNENRRKTKSVKKKRKLTDIQILSETVDNSKSSPRLDGTNHIDNNEKSLNEKETKVPEVKSQENTPDISKVSNVTEIHDKDTKESISDCLREEGMRNEILTEEKNEDKQIEEVFGYLEDAIAEYNAHGVGEDDSDIENPELRTAYESPTFGHDQFTRSTNFIEVSRPNSPIPEKNIFHLPREIRDGHMSPRQKPYKSRIFVYANPERKNLKRSKSLAINSKGQAINTTEDITGLESIQKDALCQTNYKSELDESHSDTNVNNDETFYLTQTISYKNDNSIRYDEEDVHKDRYQYLDKMLNKIKPRLDNGNVYPDIGYRSQTPVPTSLFTKRENVHLKRSNTLDSRIKTNSLRSFDTKEPFNEYFHKHEDLQNIGISNKEDLKKEQRNYSNNAFEPSTLQTSHRFVDMERLLMLKESDSTFENFQDIKDNKEQIESSAINENYKSADDRLENNLRKYDENKIKNKQLSITKAFIENSCQSAPSNSVSKTDTETSDGKQLDQKKFVKSEDEMMIDVKSQNQLDKDKTIDKQLKIERTTIPKRAITPDPIASEERGLVYNQHFASNVRRARSLNVRDKLEVIAKPLPSISFNVREANATNRTPSKHTTIVNDVNLEVETFANHQEPSIEGKTNIEVTAEKFRKARHMSPSNRNNLLTDTLLDEPTISTFSSDTNVAFTKVDVHDPTLGGTALHNIHQVLPNISYNQKQKFTTTIPDKQCNTITVPTGTDLYLNEQTFDTLNMKKYMKTSLQPISTTNNNSNDNKATDTKQGILHRSQSVQERSSSLPNGGKMPLVDEENRRKRRYSTLTSPIPTLTAVPKKSILKRPERAMSERSMSINTIPLSQFVSSATASKRMDTTNTLSYLRHEQQSWKPGDRSIAFAEKYIFIGEQGSHDSMVHRSLSYSSKNHRPPTPAVTMMGRRKRNSFLDRKDWRLSSTKL